MKVFREAMTLSFGHVGRMKCPWQSVWAWRGEALCEDGSVAKYHFSFVISLYANMESTQHTLVIKERSNSKALELSLCHWGKDSYT